MTPETCDRCGADLGDAARFCTQCGTPVNGDPVGAPPPAAEVDDDVEAARLVECEECGAPNAASRPLCAHCGTPLREEIPGGDALPEGWTADQTDPGPPPAPRGRGLDTSPVLLSLVLLAGLVTAGVLLALVTSQVRRPDGPPVAAGVAPTGATASSVVEGHRALEAIDGDPTTSWHEGADGPGVGEWLEVQLPGRTEVRRVLVWNGDQADDATFAEHGRVAGIRIEVGGRQFRVDFLDIDGPQAVDLPAGVADDRVRLVVEAVVGDQPALAISEVVVETAAD
ncbi:NADase-type glycan-binding domain-containing protein [Euzebya rosea]|uniref:NADase-type glycan-binding domain-containing protein n=1 Tax=Euzebya rosea TaxID=2052804 RepID=UPI000D3EA619|nr:zinc-ribbon domain-containing protein [Euzebya rosea]